MREHRLLKIERRRVGYLILLALLIAVGELLSPAIARNRRVRKLETIHLPHAGLEDVNKQGVLLLSAWRHDTATLLGLNPLNQETVFEIDLPDWSKWEKEVDGPLRMWGGFRFLHDGEEIAGLVGPWVMEVTRAAPARRILTSEEYLKPNLPWAPSTMGLPFQPERQKIAVNPQDDSVAVAFNVGPDPKLFIVDPHSGKQKASWTLPLFMQDLCWSPDGTKLGVLYFALLDEKRRPLLDENGRYYDLARASRTPDLSIFDPYSGKELIRITTGSLDEHISFNHKGDLIYVADAHGNYRGKRRGTIRAFTARTGKLVAEFGGPKWGWGFIQTFALSPNDKLIAADASTAIDDWLQMELKPGVKRARIVLSDAATGETLFEDNEDARGYVADPLSFAFSPDGRLLFVDYGQTKKEPYEHIAVYSLEGLLNHGQR